eukprot:Nk52_evm80s352 gene=Nk52_evmTU80s352
MTQIGTLLWKNWKLRLQRRASFLFEIVLVLAVLVLMAIYRQSLAGSPQTNMDVLLNAPYPPATKNSEFGLSCLAGSERDLWASLGESHNITIFYGPDTVEVKDFMNTAFVGTANLTLQKFNVSIDLQPKGSEEDVSSSVVDLYSNSIFNATYPYYCYSSYPTYETVYLKTYEEMEQYVIQNQTSCYDNMNYLRNFDAVGIYFSADSFISGEFSPSTAYDFKRASTTKRCSFYPAYDGELIVDCYQTNAGSGMVGSYESSTVDMTESVAPDICPYISSTDFDSLLMILGTLTDTALIRHLKPDVSNHILELHLSSPPGDSLSGYSNWSYLGVGFTLILTVVMMLVTLLPLIANVQEIVFERENRLQEAMKMMGVSSAMSSLSWVITVFVELFVICVLSWIILIPADVFFKVNPLIVMLFLLSFFLSMVALALLFSSFFQRAKYAIFVTAVISILLVVPGVVIAITDKFDSLSVAEAFGVCLLPTSCISIGADIISEYGQQGVELGWDYFSVPPTQSYSVSIMHCVVFMVVDVALFVLIGWYVDTVFPGQYGTAQPFYFFLLPSYWRSSSANVDSKRTDADISVDKGGILREHDGFINEAEIVIDQLTKTFGDFTAVDSLSLSMRVNQVCGLLGHNGAGKTTTMNMLSGWYSPTSGDATIFGKSIRYQMPQVQKLLGLCPQHNTLYDYLTVEDHIILFNALKGVSEEETRKGMDELLDDLLILDKKHTFAKDLSGGQKRKLSLCIAFSGNSKFIILDEPTSGVDPSSRRCMWDMISKNKHGKAILLSTHFMDEAEILSNQIAVMANGGLKCVGSPGFLKTSLNVGNVFSVEMKDLEYDLKCLQPFVLEKLPEAKFLEAAGTQVNFEIPYNMNAEFTKCLKEFESECSSYGVKSFGVSSNNFEQVFMKVNSMEIVSGQGDLSSKVEEVVELKDSSAPKMSPGTCTPCFFAQLQTLYWKRFIGFLRNISWVFMTVILPCVFVILGIYLMQKDKYDVNSGNASYQSGAIAPFSQWSPYSNTQYDTRLFVETGVSVAVTEGLSAPGRNVYYFESSTANGEATKYVFAGYPNQVKEINYCSVGRNGTGLSFSCRESAFGGGNVNVRFAKSLTNALAKSELGSSAEFISSQTVLSIPSPSDNQTDSGTSGQNDDNSIPETYARPLTYNGIYVLLGITVVVLGLSLATVCASVALTDERVSLSKHVTSLYVSISLFWTSNLFFDLTLYVIPVAIALGAFAGFDNPLTSDWIEYMVPVILLLVAFGMAFFPFVYLVSIRFKSSSRAFVYTITLAITMVLVPFFIIQAIDNSRYTTDSYYYPDGTVSTSFTSKAKTLQVVYDAMNVVFAFLPPFNVANGLYNLNYQYYNKSSTYNVYGNCYAYNVNLTEVYEKGLYYKSTCIIRDVYSYEVSGFYIGMLFATAVLYFGLCLLVDSGFIGRMLRKDRSPPQPDDGHEDDDVRNERNMCDIQGNALQTVELSKEFRTGVFGTGATNMAVRNSQFAVKHGECFGLLGQNGAGKSTTFKMLTGEILPSAGDAFINGKSVTKDMGEVSNQIGYCPQVDALIAKMTPEEHLRMYAVLKGIPRDEVNEHVGYWLDALDLTKYKNRQAQKLSGGNKRKLNTAIALIGSPSIIFFDEPTTGMDPKAKRLVWKVINEARNEGAAVVLTSHSMEECTALCTKMVIMFNGVSRCLGNAQHLQQKYGRGLTLGVSFDDGMRDNLREDIIAHLTQKQAKTVEVKFLEDEEGFFKLSVEGEGLSLVHIAESLEEVFVKYNILSYDLSQSSLEDVFISLGDRANEESKQNV